MARKRQKDTFKAKKSHARFFLQQSMSIIMPSMRFHLIVYALLVTFFNGSIIKVLAISEVEELFAAKRWVYSIQLVAIGAESVDIVGTELANAHRLRSVIHWRQN